MKLIYLAQIGLFDNWAHNIQIMKMCEAFSKNSVDVVLLVPKRKSFTKTDPFEMYGVARNFKIIQIPYIDIKQGTTSRLLYWIRSLSFLLSARIYLFFYKYDILYTREIISGIIFRSVYLELHSFPKKIKYFHKLSFNKVSKIIVLTNFIKIKLNDLGVIEDNILISHDGVRIEDFLNIDSISEARKKLNMNQSDFIFGYVGTLKTMGMEKGVSDAISALEFLPNNFKLYVVGGEENDINQYKDYSKDKNLLDRVIFVGKVSHKDVPLNISVCNVLVAPFPKNEHYSYFMSPLKIFEYMASRRPVVVSDLPSLKEVLVDEKTALFVPPNDPQSLANAIRRLNENSVLSARLSENAYNKVISEYTWTKRAENILNFIKQ